jgi:Flp pilus assembly protein TadD
MLNFKSIVAVLAVSVMFSGPVFAADTESTPVKNTENRDFVAGKKSIEAKDWNRAIEQFSRVVATDNKNADAYSLLAFSLRWAGRMDEAFANYDKALALDPKHRGANNYLGIAYLKVNDLSRAQAQLTKLEGICGKQCDEYQSLAKAIAEYRPK